MFKIDVLIAEDEAPARRKLLHFLQGTEDVNQVYESSNGLEALDFIQEKRPDLVLLDIQMPGLTGFELIRKIGADQMPPVVFVTAYDQYALDAFEVNAVDYLLKPFDKKRFQQAFQNALEKIRRQKEYSLLYKKLLQGFPEPVNYLDRLAVSIGNRYIFLPVEDIFYLAADDKYVKIHTAQKSYLLRETIRNLEQKLDPQLFIRIHRSYLVNIRCIREMFPRSHGDYTVVLQNDTQLTVSRRYRERLFGNK